MGVAQQVVSLGPLVEVSVTKALAAAGDYGADDLMSESASAGTVWTFSNVVPVNGGSGKITQVLAILETANLANALTLLLFNTAPTVELNDNVLNVEPTHATISEFLGFLELPAMVDLGAGDSVALATSNHQGDTLSGQLPFEFVCAAGSRNLYGLVITRAAITGETATDDLTVRLTVRQD